ncbi:conserved phage C-terminal domain-containing protein [Enterococcus faecalis]
MAERRMFAKTIIDSDAFLDMPLSSQSLYFHLAMRADDDGFINNPKKIQRMVGCGDDDLKLLMAKRFILVFESGVIVIKHWKIHNYIQKDRYKPTLYQEEKALLTDKDNKAYSFNDTVLTPVDIECIQDGYSLETQVRLGKVRLGKDSKDNMPSLPKQNSTTPKPYKLIIDYLNQKANTNYRYQTKATQTKIDARLAEGFSVDDFKTVIDKKTTEWLNDADMQKYLRPETLFGPKFESYLNQQNWQPKQYGGHQKQPVRQEQLPDWVSNPAEEKKLSPEEQARLEQELQELLGE